MRKEHTTKVYDLGQSLKDVTITDFLAFGNERSMVVSVTDAMEGLNKLDVVQRNKTDGLVRKHLDLDENGFVSGEVREGNTINNGSNYELYKHHMELYGQW
jgi:hypothetical protein